MGSMLYWLILVPPAMLCWLAWFTHRKFRQASRGELDMAVAGGLMALTGILILAYGYCWATLRIGG